MDLSSVNTSQKERIYYAQVIIQHLKKLVEENRVYDEKENLRPIVNYLCAQLFQAIDIKDCVKLYCEMLDPEHLNLHINISSQYLLRVKHLCEDQDCPVDVTKAVAMYDWLKELIKDTDNFEKNQPQIEMATKQLTKTLGLSAQICFCHTHHQRQSSPYHFYDWLSLSLFDLMDLAQEFIEIFENIADSSTQIN